MPQNLVAVHTNYPSCEVFFKRCRKVNNFSNISNALFSETVSFQEKKRSSCDLLNTEFSVLGVFFIAFYILTSQFTLYFEAAFFEMHPGFEPILGSQGLYQMLLKSSSIFFCAYFDERACRLASQVLLLGYP